MTYYDYKVVPAPRRMKKVRGVKDADELLALTLTEAINEQARQGWEYVRAESLTAEAPGGWLRRGREETQTLLVFRQVRETLGPRLAATADGVTTSAPEPARHPAQTRLEPRADPTPAPTPVRASPQPSDRPFVDRLQGLSRGEPPLDVPPKDTSAPTPLRPNPRLGPADRS